MAKVYGSEPAVVTNDDPSWPEIDLNEFDAAVISPGPGHPVVRRNLGVSLEVLADINLPTLGICLGHQAIARVMGTPVVAAPVPRHGHVSLIRHDGRDLFSEIPQFFAAVRYHSLCVPNAGLVAELEATAWAEDDVIMGLRHVSRPLWGVQFHPESVLTEHGAALLANFRRLAVAANEQRRARLPGRPILRARPATSRCAPAKSAPPARWRLLCREIPYELAAEWMFRLLFSRLPYAFWLDSSRVETGLSRFSFLGAPGGPDGEVLSYQVGGRVLINNNPEMSVHGEPESIFDVLDRRLRDREVAGPVLPFDFNGGYVGYFGYEMKSDLGSPGRHRAQTPDALWMSATRFVAIDHEERRTYLLALAREDDGRSLVSAAAWLDAARSVLQDRIESAGAASLVPPAGRRWTADTPELDPRPWARKSRKDYIDDVIECQRQLRAGESYEICLTTSMTMPSWGDPLRQYLRQRAFNPAPFAAFLKCGETSVLCSSPERFIRVGTDRVVETRPIKGTSSRDLDPIRDRQLAKDLARDDKSRAENLMIVDVMRNDLGRVCEVGSVQVPRLMHVETYATVHQLLSTITGRLRATQSAIDCVRACFPGGSMTGAPRLRAMEIIDRLESGPRGIYSGSLGYLGLNGSADLNIVIRTIVWQGESMTVGAGGAIVLGSDPHAEYEEMLLKARAPLRGLRP
jgi:para-aminobenzoate synthetase